MLIFVQRSKLYSLTLTLEIPPRVIESNKEQKDLPGNTKKCGFSLFGYF